MKNIDALLNKIDAIINKAVSNKYISETDLLSIYVFYESIIRYLSIDNRYSRKSKKNIKVIEMRKFHKEANDAYKQVKMSMIESGYFDPYNHLDFR